MLIFLQVMDNDEDRMTLEELFVKYSDDMYRAAMMKLNNDHHASQDVVQNLIIYFAENMDKLHNVQEGKMRGYLVTCAQNTSVNYTRGNKEVVVYEEIDCIDESIDSDLERHVLNVESGNEMMKMLNKINSELAQAVYLSFYQDLSNSEIASALDITTNAVYIRIHRAKKELKKLFEEGSGYFDNFKK